MLRHSSRIALLALCLSQGSPACSSEDGSNSPPSVASPTPGFAGAGASALPKAGTAPTAGAGAAGAPRAPSSNAMAGSPSAVAGGSAGTSAAPAGSPTASGAQAVAGAPASGSQAAAGGIAGARSPIGGTAAAAAGSGGTAAPAPDPSVTPGGPFIREKDPTEQSVAAMGEYAVKSYTEAMGLVGGTAYGDAAILADGSELYYPEGATAPFAAVAIVPGFTAQRSDIAPWASFLASHGIVSLAIDTNTVGDLPDVRSQALLDALASLKKENMREGSPIKAKLDVSRLAVMGWSMGGGGTWLTADSHPELKAAVSLCGWILDPVGSRTKVPSLQLAVQDDELAAAMSQPVYAAIPNSTPKMLVEWTSGGHWTNNTPSNQGNQVGRYGLAWLKVFLEGDDRYRQFFTTMPKGSSDFKTNQK